MKTIGNVQKDGQVRAVASGALTEGTAVVVNADGTVSVPFNAKTIYNEALSQTNTIATNGSGTFVILWVNTAPSYQGYVVAGTISGNTVTLGTPVLYVSEGNIADENTSIVYDPDEDKFVLVYSDGGAGNYLTARVVSVSGTTITFGTAVVINSQNVASSQAVYDTSANKVVIAFRGHTNDYLAGVVGTVSGTSISFGSLTTLVSAGGSIGRPYYVRAVYDANADKTAVFWQNDGDTDGYYVVCTVSGTGISAGTAAKFNNANTYSIAAVYDSTAQKIVVAYQDGGNNNYGTAIVGTISGTSMSFGSAVVFSGTSYVGALTASYDSTNNKTFVFYDKADSAATGIIGTVSGTSISFGSEGTFTSGNINYTSSTFDSSAGKALFVYRDLGNSSYGTLFAVDTSLATGNFTSENFIGFSDGAYATTQSAVINTANTIDRNQTSLTAGQTYFVLPTGALSLTAGSPSVTAGTAISNTELIVKG